MSCTVSAIIEGCVCHTEMTVPYDVTHLEKSTDLTWTLF